MNLKVRTKLIFILTGLVLINLTLFHPYFKSMADVTKGFFVGIGIALIAMPLLLSKLVHNREQQ